MKAFYTELEDDTLFISGSGFAMIDISDPASPVVIVDQSMDNALKILVNGEVAYRALGVFGARGGIGILDYSDPESITESVFPAHGNVRDFVLHEQNLYTLFKYDEIVVFNPSGQCGYCPADLDKNSVLDFFDVSFFLEAFLAQDALVDFDGNGIFDFFDVAEFLERFALGCD